MSSWLASSWLTGVRLERLCLVAASIPSSQLGDRTRDVLTAAWETAGGDQGEIEQLVDILKRSSLAAEQDGILRRTRDGDRVVRALRNEDRTHLGVALIRAGLLHDQARHLIETGTSHANGDLVCEQRTARAGAAQLVGMLSWWDISTWPAIVVPKTLLDELSTVWALLPPAPETPTWVVERQEIGNRAEMYTVQVERLGAANPGDVVWVARDSSSLGWDVEDRAAAPLRRIEVKGSRQVEPIFFFSENEWKKANDHADTYEVHFWGGIDLARSPADEFSALRAAGFPIIIKRVVEEVASGRWLAVPTNWRITRCP